MSLVTSTIPSPTHYVNWGFRPTPLTRGTKIPRLKSWPTVAADPGDWYPGEGIGLVCGLQPDGTYLTCLDFDHRPEQNIDACAHYEKFMDEVEFDVWCKTFGTASTSGNGRHVYIKTPQEIRKGKLVVDGVTIGDVLGTGAQVVAQHPSKWLHRQPGRVKVLTPEETTGLLAFINYEPEPEKPTYTPTHTTTHIRPGDDFNARGDVEAVLAKHGWDMVHRRSDVTQWRRPGKSESISATLNHIPGIFYNFSSSAAPFEPRRGYTPFAVYTLLVHNGNFRAAARDLAAQGYGSPDATHDSESHQASWVATGDVGGRPLSHDHMLLYRHMADHSDCGRCGLTNQELAAAMNVSVRTIIRWLNMLETHDLIHREQSNAGRWIVLSAETGGDNNLARVYKVLQSSTNTVDLKGGVGENTPAVTPDFAVCETCANGELAPDEQSILRCSYCDQAIPVAQLVTEAFDLYEYVKPRARRYEIMLNHVASNGRPDLDSESVQSAINRVRMVRRQTRSDNRYCAKLRTLSDAALDRREKSVTAKHEELRKERKHGQAVVWARMAWLIGLEQERREPLRKALGRYDNRKRSLFEADHESV
jgi:hypothetical protein